MLRGMVLGIGGHRPKGRWKLNTDGSRGKGDGYKTCGVLFVMRLVLGLWGSVNLLEFVLVLKLNFEKHLLVLFVRGIEEFDNLCWK
ncbi:hypothetical protein V6N11_077583 [Hibiscus sabdariffa]|uniref:Transmembrane protein n=1 Tax=Hibiscus sabdariffa TaxID=183260 RepID=A0ABR2TDH4_9ROSI